MILLQRCSGVLIVFLKVVWQARLITKSNVNLIQLYPIPHKIMTENIKRGGKTDLITQDNASTGIKPLPHKQRLHKSCLLAKYRLKDQLQKRINICIEENFMSVLNEVKFYHAQQPQIVFERDYRHDNRENAHAMHAFISNSFYFYLECDLVYHYKVEFAFHDCAYESKFRDLLSRFQLNKQIKEVALQPSFPIFYKAVLAIQDPKYTYLLKEQ
jgi:hypothetical protein